MTLSSKIIIPFTLLICSCRSNGKHGEQTNNTTKQTDTAKNVYPPPVIDPDLLNVWNNFKRIVTTRDYQEFRKISLDKIAACDDTLDISNFSKKCFLGVFDTTIIRLMSNKSYTDYTDRSIMREHLPQYLRDEIRVTRSSFDLHQFQILKELTPDGGWTITFDFIKTKNGYKFFGCDSFGGPICCR